MLWRDTLMKNPGAWMAHNNLGGILCAQGKLEEATVLFQRALKHTNQLNNTQKCQQQ